jgi:hypothetical protein
MKKELKMCKKIIVITLVLVMLSLLIACREESLSTQEIISAVIEAKDNIRTYEFEMNMTAEVPFEQSEDNFIMTKNFFGIVNLDKKEIMMDLTTNYPDEIRYVTYLIDDVIWDMEGIPGEECWSTPYEASDEEFGQIIKQINSDSLIDYMTELLRTSQADVIGSEKVKGFDCYILQLTPNLEQLCSLAMQNKIVEYIFWWFDISPEDVPQELFSGFSVKQWVTKNTYFLTKVEINITLEFSPEMIGLGEEDGATTIPITMNLLVSNHNKPLNIILPSEAAEIAQYRVTYVLHYDGMGWKTISVGAEELDKPIEEGLCDIWGNSAKDVYICGQNVEGGYIRHYDGITWNKIDAPQDIALNEIWGSSSTNVYIVGNDLNCNGLIIHYNGENWKEVDIIEVGSLIGIWGSSPSDIFTVGSKGNILHFDGDNWSKMESNTEEALVGVWGSSATDVFAVGYNGTILHYNGDSWEKMHSGTNKALTGGVWGSSTSNVFAVGEYGTILHYDGSIWTEMDSGITDSVTVLWEGIPTSTPYYLNDIWGNSSSNIFSVGEPGIIMHYDGNTWTQVSIIVPCSWALKGVWGSSLSDIYVIFDIRE